MSYFESLQFLKLKFYEFMGAIFINVMESGD